MEKYLLNQKLLKSCQSNTVANMALARQCLEQGADVNCLDDLRPGDTPLMNAVLNNNIELVNLLLDYQADINHINDRDQTALIYAVQLYYPVMVDCLLQRGANVNLENSMGNTALHFVEDNSDVAELLLKKKANIYHPNNAHKTPFNYAAMHKHNNTLKKFIDYQMLSLNDALLMSALHNNCDILTYVINKGVDINYQAFDGQTAFMTSVRQKSMGCVFELLKNDADLTIKDHEGQTWIDYVLFQDRQKMNDMVSNLKEQIILDRHINHNLDSQERLNF